MRSTPTRGLATAAVGALALTGLATTAPAPAHADGEGAVLLTQFTDGGDASLRYDGTDSTIRLEAQRLDPTATLSFDYNPDPAAAADSSGWVAIPTTAVQDAGDYYAINWDASSVTEPTVALRVAAAASSGTTYDVRNDVAILPTTDTVQHSVALTQADDLGYFVQPYTQSSRTAPLAAVGGTTSAMEGQVALSVWRTDDGAFAGATSAEVGPAPCKVITPELCIPIGNYGEFDSELDLTPYDADAGDVLVVGAARDTDAVEAYTLYQQSLASVTVSSEDDGRVREGETGEVEVLVRDGDNQPVAGAEVRRHSDGALVGYTDGAGTVSTEQPAGTAVSYYANTTDVDAYEGDSDPATLETDPLSAPFTVTPYVPEPSQVQLRFADGSAFDDDEYADGDISVVVLDQVGREFGPGAEVAYRIYPDGTVPPVDYTTVTTDDQSRAPLAFDPAGPDGTYRLDHRLASASTDSTTTFVAGDATLALTPASSTVGGPIGGAIDYTGTLRVGDVPLPGRKVSLRYLRGVEVVPGRVPDAGIVNGTSRVLARTVTTDGDGAFTFSVADRSERPRASEVGGRLVAATATATPSQSSSLSGNAREQDTSTTRFGDRKRVKVRLALSGTGQGSRADVLRVNGPASAAGETVRFYRVVGGRRQLITAKRLDRNGDVRRLVVADRNSTDPTRYVVRMPTSRRVLASESPSRPVR